MHNASLHHATNTVLQHGYASQDETPAASQVSLAASEPAVAGANGVTDGDAVDGGSPVPSQVVQPKRHAREQTMRGNKKVCGCSMVMMSSICNLGC